MINTNNRCLLLQNIITIVVFLTIKIKVKHKESAFISANHIIELPLYLQTFSDSDFFIFFDIFEMLDDVEIFIKIIAKKISDKLTKQITIKFFKQEIHKRSELDLSIRIINTYTISYDIKSVLIA